MKLTSFFSRPLHISLALPALLSLSLLLAACGSGSSSKTECTSKNSKGECTNPNGGSSGTVDFVYKGEKPAATADVLKFQQELWINLAPADRCGGCHTATGQTPSFARADDINLAYDAVISNSLVSLASPAESHIVQKVSKGHNCWLKDPVACGDTITTWITKWAGSAGTVKNDVVLKAPAVKDIASSKAFPKDSAAFATTVYPLLKQYCSRCHSETALTKQQPYFASDDVAVAYEAAKTKIRLDSPQDSRFVQRLRTDFHNCWSDCSTNADDMQRQIKAFSDSLTPIQIDPALVVSKAVGLGDAFVLTSGGRVDTNLIAKYEFKTGKGTIAYDTSGISPSTDLNLLGNVAWSSAWGIKIRDNGRAQATTTSSRKIFDLVRGSGEYSIEAWIIPDNVTQGTNDNNPARIVSFSGSTEARNFTLGQYEYNYSFLNRTDKSTANGLKELHTKDADKRLQATLQHIVVTFDPTNGRRIYVNGEDTKDADPDKGATLKDWDSNFALVLGNEVSGDRLWQGSIRFLGIHKRAMTPADIESNYKVGVGAKYLLLFNVSDLIGTAGSYIVFEVQQFDDYGYLFANPFFTNLEGKTIDSDIALQGIRIGLNGEEAPTGQVFAHLNTNLNSSQAVNGRQTLSTLGTVVAAKNGPDTDQFFITFDKIGSHEYARAATPSSPLAASADIADQALIGVHTFAEINATLATLTGVAHTNTAVNTTYLKVQQQLPTVANLDGFLAAQQMGITQLTVAYCNALVNDTTLRSNYFTGFNFNAPVNTVFDVTGRSQIIEPLLTRLLAREISQSSGPNVALLTQADPAELRLELNQLITKMASSCGPISCQERTLTTVKATCSAALGSAVMLLH